MRYILKHAAMLLVGACMFTIGYAQSLDRQVIGSAGGYSGTVGGLQLYYNTGETFTSVLSGGGLIVYEGFEQSDNYKPWFARGGRQALTVCRNSAATSINTRLKGYDIDKGQSTSMYCGMLPVHGVLAGSYTGVSTGDTVTPSGFTYTPTTGYTGTDSFSVVVKDGIDSSVAVVVVAVEAVPTAISGPATLCPGGSISLSADV